MKKHFISAVALLLLIATLFSACGKKSAEEKSSNKQDSSTSTEDSNAPVNVGAIDGVDAFGGQRFPEMVWGYYKADSYYYDGSFETSATFREGMEYTVFEEFGDTKLSILPLTVYFGKYSHFMSNFTYDGKYYYAYTELGRTMFRKAYMQEFGDLTEDDFQKIEKILDLNVVKVDFAQENGAIRSGVFVYELKNNKICLYNVTIDDEYNVLTDKDPFAEYDFLHDGSKLILAHDDIQRNYLTYGNNPKDTSLDIVGFALNKKNTYKDLEGISFTQFHDNGNIYLHVYLTGGRTAIDPVLEYNKDDGSFTLSWEQHWQNSQKVDDARTISGKIIPCTNHGSTSYTGFFLIVDGTCYRYLMSYDEYDEKRYGNVYDSGNVNEDDLDDINQKKDDILEDLKTAFDNAGIPVEIDTESGKVALEANFLFDSDSYALSDSGKEYLNTFVDVYTSVVLEGEHSAYVAGVVIEGHTDTSGTYSYNQTLSQNRADAVATQCISRNSSIASVIQTSGCSYDYPVYNEDGTVNMEKSRRVTFRFLLTTG